VLLFSTLAIVASAQQNELFEAARVGDLSKLQALASDKSAVDVRGPHDRTALHEAAANCQFAAAKILVDHGWNTQAIDDEKKPPVNLVSNCPDNVRTALYLLLRPKIQEKEPWSLQYAAAHRQANVVAMLVNMGTDVNGVGSEGNRALELSCLQGDAASAKILLEHGAWSTAPIRIFAAKLVLRRFTTQPSAGK